MKSQVIQLKEGDSIKVDQQVQGYTITGPALVVVIIEEAAAGTTASGEQPLKYGESKWDDGSKWS